MVKEHKKLYKAGKNWVVATLFATSLGIFLGGGDERFSWYDANEFSDVRWFDEWSS